MRNGRRISTLSLVSLCLGLLLWPLLLFPVVGLLDAALSRPSGWAWAVLALAYEGLWLRWLYQGTRPGGEKLRGRPRKQGGDNPA